MVRLSHLLLAASLAIAPVVKAETWPHAVALPELSGSLLPYFWETRGEMVTPIPADFTRVSTVLWPKTGPGIVLLDANRQAQLELRFEQFGDALLMAVYLRRHGRGDFVYIKAGRDSSVPLASWIVRPGRWGQLQVEWPAAETGASLKVTWEGKTEEFKWANGTLTPCAYVHVPAGVRFALLGYSIETTSLYP